MDMRILVVIIVTTLVTPCCRGFILTSPRMFYYEVEESILLTGTVQSETTEVTVSLKDWPDKRKSIYESVFTLTGTETKEIKVSLDYADLHDGTSLGKKSYMYLIAKAGYFTKQVIVEIRGHGKNIFLQTDKPIYTSEQKVHISVYSTDLNNKLVTIPVKLEVKSPSGIVVQRKYVETVHRDKRTGGSVVGLFRGQFDISAKPMTGTWSILASYSSESSNYDKNGNEVVTEFEVEDYVLPSFSCSLMGLPDFILLDSTNDVTDTAMVSGRYTFGKPLLGSVIVRYGILLNDKHIYIVQEKGEFFHGKFEFKVSHQTIKRMLNQIDRNLELNGMHLTIKAECLERSSGQRVEDSLDHIIFVDSPYKFNFDASPVLAKTGMPLNFKFQLQDVHKKPVNSKTISVLFMINSESRENSTTTVNTNKYGYADVSYAIPGDAETVAVKLKTDYKGLPVTDSYTLQVSNQNHDLAVRTMGILYHLQDVVHVEIYTKGGPFSHCVLTVQAKGRVITTKTFPYTGVKIVQIAVTENMIPRARVMAYCVMNGREIVGDSTWFNVEDQCKAKMKTQEESYNLDNTPYIQLLVSGAYPNSYVVPQMVDHAALALNNEVTLTKEKVLSTLLSLDQDDTCSGYSGSKFVEHNFWEAGLAVATTLRQKNGDRPVSALSPFHCSTSSSRKRRSATQETPSKSECCDMGATAANSDVVDCELKALNFALNHAIKNIDECLHTFKQCCFNSTTPEGDTDLDIDRSNFGKDNIRIKAALLNTRIRRRFPHSVIFPVLRTDGNGNYAYDFNAPQSITTWRIEAVQMSDQSGLCVLPHTDFTVFKEHFLKVNLPHHAIRGEHLLVKATFYNYMNLAIDVDFFLSTDSGICSKAKANEFTKKISRTVYGKNSMTVSWPVVPLKTGKHYLRVIVLQSQEKDKALDAVERELLVSPEGIRSGINLPITLKPSSDETDPYCRESAFHKWQCEVPVNLPPNYVSDSASGRITVTSASFGNAVDILVGGLAKHLRMPYGCGEQVMILTAPGIYAYSYMLNKYEVDSDIEQKFREIVLNGVQRILTYRKDTGGISVWTHTPASTWLTSFVLKVFSKASQINAKVDQQLLDSAAKFLYLHQANDGKFEENSVLALHHGGMTGAIRETDLTLTAYVVISLNEADTQLKIHKESLARSLVYLADRLREIRWSYEASLVAYALSNSRYKAQAYSVLKLYAIEPVVGGLSLRHFGPEIKRISKAVKIETASYAILTALNNDDIDYCHNIVRWLHYQRQMGGTFHSTQDTVIALQALSAYASSLNALETNMKITFSDDKGWKFKQVHVTEDINVDQENVVEIPPEILGHQHFTIEASGHGEVFVNVELNINTQSENTCLFDLEVRLTKGKVEQDANSLNHMGGMFITNALGEEKAQPYNIHICTKFLGSDPTQMAILDVGLLTGLEPDRDNLEQMVDKGIISNYEVSNYNVIIYLPTILPSVATCLNILTKQTEKAANLSPAAVKVYDYYNRDLQCSTFYSDDSSWHILFEGDKCYEGLCGKCAGNPYANTVPWSLEYYMEIMCTPAVTYVLKVKLEGQINKGKNEIFDRYNATVAAVLKRGAYSYLPGVTLELTKLARCVCPHFDEDEDKGKFFLVLGRHEERIAGGIFRLTLDQHSYVEAWNSRHRSTHRRLRMRLRRQICFD